MSKESGSVSTLEHSASQALSGAALSTTTAWTCRFRNLRVTLKASEAITENITVTLKSRLGSSYDIPLVKDFPLTEESSYKQAWNEVYGQDYEVQVQCTNANTTGTVYCAVTAVRT